MMMLMPTACCHLQAGSAVCSPTRASALTGRTSNRECVGGAEGCGQSPAWNCGDNLPLSPRTFTIAKAAKKKGCF